MPKLRVIAEYGPAQVEQALDGDDRAKREFLRALRPALHAEIAYALMPVARASGRDPRDQVRDLVQEVFIHLLDDGAKALRSWDPQRGSSLEGFIKLIARRHVFGVLRSRRRNPFNRIPHAPETIEALVGPDMRMDGQVEAREDLDQLMAQLERQLSVRSLRLFELLYVDGRPVEEVGALMGMTRDAVYTWRTRFKKQLRKIVKESAS